MVYNHYYIYDKYAFIGSAQRNERSDIRYYG
jgi:hypothetical protein